MSEIDPRDIRIKELEAENKRLIKALERWMGESFDDMEPQAIIEPLKAISAPVKAIPEIPDSLLEEEFEAMRKALEELNETKVQAI
jgi:hypothetical protein